MNRLAIPTFALALTGTLALAACSDTAVHTAADDRAVVPDTTAAAEPVITDDTPHLQNDALDRADRDDVRTMGDVNDPYNQDRVLDGDRNADPLEDAAEEVEQELEEVDREIRN